MIGGTGLQDKNIVEHNDFDHVSRGVHRPPSTSPVAENTPEEAVLFADFADMLPCGGSETTVMPEIQRIKFSKNLWNGVLGASHAALTPLSLRAVFRPPHLEPGYAGPPPGRRPPPPTSCPPGSLSTCTLRARPRLQRRLPRSPVPQISDAIGRYTIPFLYDALTEVHALGAILYPPSSSGSVPVPVPVPGLDPEVAHLKTLANTVRPHARPDSTHLPSMLVDVQAGRPMEVEHVVGEVVRMGRAAGVAMPRMEALYALLLVMQNQFLRQQREG